MKQHSDAVLSLACFFYFSLGQRVCIELEFINMTSITEALLQQLIARRSENEAVTVLVSLLPNENKVSVLHFALQRSQAYTEPIKAKDTLLFQVGFRSFFTKPIFSESNLNCDKHRAERFLMVSSSEGGRQYHSLLFLHRHWLFYFCLLVRICPEWWIFCRELLRTGIDDPQLSIVGIQASW